MRRVVEQLQRKLANQTNAYSEPDGYSQRSATEGTTPGYNGAEGIVAWRSVPLDKDMDIRVFPFAESEARLPASHSSFPSRYATTRSLSLPFSSPSARYVNGRARARVDTRG